MDFATQITTTTECRRHNGQCEYGDWMDLTDDRVPPHVADAIVDEIVEAQCRDVRREAHDGSDCDSGRVNVGGQVWVYRR